MKWYWQIQHPFYGGAGFWTTTPAGKIGVDFKKATPEEEKELNAPAWPTLTKFAQALDKVID